jgi:flagellar FliL protein
LAEEEVAKKKSPLIMIVALVVVGLILAGGVSYFIATKVMADSVGKVPTREPGVFVKLGDAKDGIIVNVGGVKSGRFLKVGLVLEMNPEKGVDQTGKVSSATETKILDSVLQILRAQKVEDFDPSKQEELKVEIKDELNKLIGENAVYEVYITNFVLQ